MTDPSQYFKGRTVQEQMNEVIGYVDVRSAEVATDAIASDVAQVHSDAADAHADALAAAASAAAAAGTLTNAVKKTGEASQSIDGDIDLNDDLNVDGDATVGGALAVTGAVTVPTPVNNTDAATKKYVDDADALKVSITDINSYAVGLTGNQNAIAGNKNFTGLVTLSMSRIGSTGGSGYTIVYRFKNNHTQTLLITGGRTVVVAQVHSSGGYKGQLFTVGRDYTTPSWMWVVTDANTGEIFLVTRGLYSATMNIHVINSFQYGSVYPIGDDVEAVNQSTTDPTTDSRWSTVTEVANYD